MVAPGRRYPSKMVEDGVIHRRQGVAAPCQYQTSGAAGGVTVAWVPACC
jgi:hypothetical protein